MVLTRRRTYPVDQPAAHQPRVEAQPETHERWRQTTLGSFTQARELEVVFDLAGHPSEKTPPKRRPSRCDSCAGRGRWPRFGVSADEAFSDWTKFTQRTFPALAGQCVGPPGDVAFR
jgi:hypothetical protein